MAAPNYATDLTTQLQGNEATETWDESSNAAYDDGGAMVDDGNLYYINSECVSAQFTKAGIGSIIGALGTTITVPTDGAILMHHLWAAPPALATLANGGTMMLIGDGFGDFDVYDVSGSDAPPSPEGGWATYAVDPAQTPRTTVGSPSVISFVGGAVSATAQARGNPHAVQAIRYGRCEQIYTDGDSGDPAKFSGYAAIDSSVTTRYNLLQPIKGGYQQRGLVSIGTSATEVYFDDANVNISLAEDINVSANFNRWEINNVNSMVQFTAVNITALGTTSKGQFVVVDNAAVEKTACTFTDMDYFIYQSNSIITSTTYRRCGEITQGGADFIKCLITNSTASAAMTVATLDTLDDCTFESDGTGYAIDLETISADVSMSWNCTTSGYASSDGSTGNEVIYVSVDSGKTLTINVSGVPSPTVNNAGSGTVSVVNAVSLTIQGTVSLVGAEVRIYDYNGSGGSLGDELAGVESHGSATYIYSGSSGNVIWIQIMLADYEEFGIELTMPSSASTYLAQLNLDLND